MNDMHNDFYALSKLKTPCYIVDGPKLTENIEDVRQAFEKEWGKNVTIGYSVKTNHLPYLMQQAKAAGLSAEVVSVDEYLYALSQGFTNIIYNGPQKDKETLIDAINKGFIVNLDNFNDLKIIEDNTADIDRNKCWIGIRVNFDLGSVVSKDELLLNNEVSRFGFCVENGDFENVLLTLKKLNIPVRGLHMHTNSRTRSLAIYRALARKVSELILKYKLLNELRFIDIGGGFWGGRVLANKPTMKEYSAVIANALRASISSDRTQLILEPGISIIATVVEYCTRVINIKDVRDTRIVTVDGTLYHINPAFTNTQREFCSNSEKGKVIPYQIVCGCTCVENDRLLRLYNHNEFREGDIIKFLYVGAYTMCFNSYFINCPPRIYIKNDDKYCLVRDKSIDLMSII